MLLADSSTKLQKGNESTFQWVLRPNQFTQQMKFATFITRKTIDATTYTIDALGLGIFATGKQSSRLL